MSGRKSGGISTIAVRPETLEVQAMTLAQAKTIVNKAVKLIYEWEAAGRHQDNSGIASLKFLELEEKVCTHFMAKAMRFNARPDKDNIMSQAEAGAIIFKTQKSWQRWENAVAPISLSDVYLFLLMTGQINPPMNGK